MITSLQIENLRGIGRGELDELAPLTVLTGPNACGKSTVLDALLIVASPNPADAVGRAIRRHPATPGGARWLFRCDRQTAVVRARTEDRRWERALTLEDRCDDGLRKELMERDAPPPYSMIEIERPGGESLPVSRVVVAGDNQYSFDSELDSSPLSFVRLVDPGLPIPLHRSFTTVSQAGRREHVHELLVALLPGFERLEIVALTDRDFGLAITRNGHSVPVGLSGDGTQALTQMALEIAVAPEGLVLVEEPEVYQHPRAIRQSALALLANVRRGVQIVLTTHSLELIDALLAEADDEDVDRMALFNLALEDAELRWGRRAGEEIAFARETLENDLR